MRQTVAPEVVPQAEGILEEHRQLHGYLERVEAALSAPPTPEAAAVWLADLAFSLSELAPFLRAHFGREEEEGLFDRIQATWPHAAHICDRLLSEHPVLLARLAGLRAESEPGPLTEEALGALVSGVRSLLRLFAFSSG